jgi:hypothetical protein
VAAGVGVVGRFRGAAGCGAACAADVGLPAAAGRGEAAFGTTAALAGAGRLAGVVKPRDQPGEQAKPKCHQQVIRTRDRMQHAGQQASGLMALMCKNR